jgi:fatty acid desaturase
MVEPSPETVLVNELNRCRRGLARAEAGGGGLRIAALLASLSLGGALYWRADPLLLRLCGLALVSASETFLLIATHEACHRTLLRDPRLEQLLAAAISWPMAWPFFSYRLLHQLHHLWNGRDERDPERINLQSRHPLWSAVALQAGLGLMAKTYRAAWELRGVRPRLRQSLKLDAAGVVIVQTLLLSLAIWQGVLLEYLLSWIVVERLSGGFLQLRGLVEHWGLEHPPQRNQLLVQLYGSRTIKVTPALNWLMGGLPHHSAHHAYPSVPSDQLPLLTKQIEQTLKTHEYPPLPGSENYGQAIAELL